MINDSWRNPGLINNARDKVREVKSGGRKRRQQTGIYSSFHSLGRRVYNIYYNIYLVTRSYGN